MQDGPRFVRSGPGRRQAGDDRVGQVRRPQVQQGLGAEELAPQHPQLHAAGLGRGMQAHILRADAKAQRCPVRRRHARGKHLIAPASPPAGDPHGQQIDARAADEAGHVDMGGIAVDVGRGGDLQQPAAEHDGDPVGHAQRLLLVMRYIQRGDPGAPVQLDDLGAHVHAQAGVEVGQRLVHQEGLRVAHQGAAERHTLALPARHLAGLAIQQGGDAQGFGRLFHLGLDGGADGAAAGQQAADQRQARGEPQPSHGQRQRHVLPRGEMRIERVGLEHHGDVALGRAGDGHVAARHQHLPPVRPLQPGGDAQQRRLAAAGRADQGDELAACRVQGDVGQDAGGAEAFLDTDQAKLRRLHRAHAWPATGGG